MHTVSATALQALLAQNTAEVFVPLLRIEHPDLPAPILLAYNTETVHRADGDYLPYPFQINLPAQRDDQVSQVSITIDNTDLAVNDAIRALSGTPTVTLMIVLASTPDTIEAGPFVMALQQANADANTITGTLGQEDDVFAQNAPGQQFLPTNAAGLFA